MNNNTQEVDCTKYKMQFSDKTGAIKPVGWRCKDVVKCPFCRRIEAGKISSAMKNAHATIYLIDKDEWDTYRRTLHNNSDLGYIKIPQKNDKVAVYSHVQPRCEHTVLSFLSEDELLANRLDKDVKGRTSRTGIFAIQKDNEKEDGDDETVKIRWYFPLFRYKESGKIMPYQEYIAIAISLAYRESPCTTITKDNAEDHLRFVSNYIISIMMKEPLYRGKIEPLVKVDTKNIRVSYFSNWVDGADIKMSGIKNRFDDSAIQEMDDLLMSGEPPFDWVGYCLDNGLVYDSDKSKSYYESKRALEEGDKQILEMVEKFGTTN